MYSIKINVKKIFNYETICAKYSNVYIHSAFN